VLLAAGLRTAYAVVFEINTVYTRVFVHFYDGASISISRSNKIHLCQGDVNAGMQGCSDAVTQGIPRGGCPAQSEAHSAGALLPV
jgi:hypothetical protein